MTFEYVGASTLRVVGPVTRREYWFSRPGARAAVDARDAAAVTAVPRLVRVT
jgi:hypothetical protein